MRTYPITYQITQYVKHRAQYSPNALNTDYKTVNNIFEKNVLFNKLKSSDLNYGVSIIQHKFISLAQFNFLHQLLRRCDFMPPNDRNQFADASSVYCFYDDGDDIKMIKSLLRKGMIKIDAPIDEVNSCTMIDIVVGYVTIVDEKKQEFELRNYSLKE